MNLSYSSFMYVCAFLPFVMFFYSVFKRQRKAVLLVCNYLFFIVWSRKLVAWNIGVSVIVYFVSKILEKHKQKILLAMGICVPLVSLVVLKYTNFLLENISHVFHTAYTPLQILIPIGISYYSLMMISYLVDVYQGKCQSAEKVTDFLLYTSYFPTLVQGPIVRFKDISQTLLKTHDIRLQNIQDGYIRIIWGLLKKVVIADHLNAIVNPVFQTYSHIGSLVVLGSILWTIQLYMDFAGTIDIAIGSAQIFGVQVQENFRQPFFAKNAGDFWRRWHITLGTFFKDYIFYPVSLNKKLAKFSRILKKHHLKQIAKYFSSIIALFFVWMCNGLWHGPKWTYIFYGMYYFVIIVAELIVKKPIENLYQKIHLNEKNTFYRLFVFTKLCVIVVIGEMFFKAESVMQGWTMLKSVFTNFAYQDFIPGLQAIKVHPRVYMIVVCTLVPILAMSFYLEKGHTIQDFVDAKPTWLKWTYIYIALFIIFLFGAFGPGYGNLAMMYAGF